MFNKCSILVGFLLAVGVAAIQLRGPVNFGYVGNNLYLGQRRSGDRSLGQYPVYRAAVAQRVVTQTLNINAGYYNITYIAATDLSQNKTAGAYARLVKGGPGSRNATILFTSKVGQPINFRVNAFAK